MKNVIIVLLVLVCFGFLVILFSIFGPSVITPNGPNHSSNYQALHKAMSYLSEIPEVEWHEIQRNNVYIGFKQLPSDWRIIINGAALRGNEAMNFGCHIWAIDANKFNEGWRPGDGPFYGEMTARYGKLQD